MDTQTQIERLIELAIVQRTELKQLVEQLPQLRDHLTSEVEKTFEEAEPQLRSELEEFCEKRATDANAKVGTALEARIASLAADLQVSTQARFDVLKEQERKLEALRADAKQEIAAQVATMPDAVKEIVTAELARFPRAGEIDQLRKEFAEPRGLNPRGKWLPDETYNKLDLVTFNGDSYVSNIDGNKERPTRTAANWTLNAARGASGGGGGITSLNDVLNAPTAGQIVGSQNGQYVPKTLVAGANITINETASAITIIGDEGEISLQDGTAAAPALFFTNDTDTGIYRPAANTLGISVSGTQIAYFDANGLTVPSAGVVAGGSFHGANGNANNPSLSFSGDQDTGFFRHQSNELGITLGGVQKATLTSTTFSITPNLVVSGTGSINGTSIPASKTLVVTTDKLSALASTSSSELAGVISDETGTGSLVFANTPTLVTPNIGAATGTSLTVTGNVTASDSILGTSGPSVKSTLSARAPRQGLVFDGTAGATISSAIPAFGTGDFTLTAWTKFNNLPAAGENSIFGSTYGATRGISIRRVSDGGLVVDRAGIVNMGSALLTNQTAGVIQMLTVVRSAGVLTIYQNGVALSTTQGTPTADLDGVTDIIGAISGGTSLVMNGTIAPLAYNRALSASEVVSLYEAGAPSSADYNNASNTSLVTGDNSTFASNTGFWTLYASVSITGGEAVWTGGGSISASSITLRKGRQYKLTINITEASSNGWSWFNGSAYTSTGLTGTGSKSVVLTPVADTAFGMTNGDAANGKLTDLTLIPLGLLLAPDAAQAGGGLVWYDTSGNAANITLPASGVSWNVPSSRVLGGNWTATGTVSLKTPSTTTQLDFQNPSGTTIQSLKYTDSDGSLTIGGSAGVAVPLIFTSQSGTERMRMFANGTLGLGTGSIDSANGKLQLATHTTSAGGIGFGTDTSLYRGASGIGTLELSASSGTVSIFKVALAGTAKAQFGIAAGATYIDYDGSLIVRNGIGGTTALTLDSSQRIICGGALRLNNAYTAGAPTATGYVTIQDSAGNTYKVLVGT